MIILHEYPLSMVEHSRFIDFANTISPMFQLMSRNTIRSDIMKIHKLEKEKCGEILKKNKSRIALTTDMWTANHQKKGYMAVTAHFIDDAWTLHSRIISFKYVPCPHDASALTEALSSSMSEWSIEDKVSTVTLDNASTNDAMIPLLKQKFDPSCFILNGELLHMRCCAHVLNLIVRGGLSVIGDSVDKIRDSVAYWSGTPKWHEKFEENVRHLGVTCTKKLSLDCVTRWNSTYLMIKTALLYKVVFERAKLCDPKYKCLPSEDDWIRAQKLCERLEVFHEVTELFSGTKYPTANLFFPEMCKIKRKIEEGMSSNELFIKDMSTQMMFKFQKYWEQIHGIMTIAVVLDPRYKFLLLQFYFPQLYGDDKWEVEIRKVRRLCVDLFNEYKSKCPTLSENNSLVEGSSSSSTQDHLSNYDLYVRASSGAMNEKSELDLYLDDQVLPRTDEFFDICNYWKITGSKYPVLNMIARDIFAVLVSTVASESSFSTGGRHVSPHRARLHPTTLEALVCTQSWLAIDKQGTKTKLITEPYTVNLED
ncbi:hypothetical protein CsatA_003025 [Cannabis sativa]